MKRSIFIATLIGFGACIQAQQSVQTQTQVQAPISREEIEHVLDTPDFKQLAQMMGIPVENMTSAEKQALVDDTLAFGQQMEQLPPQEQEKIMQDIFSQVAEPTKQEMPETVAPETKGEEKPKEKTPEKEKVSTKKITSGKKAVEKLAKQLEQIELKFDSLLIASPESALEQDWARIKTDLPWTLSALHRIGNSNKVLEHLVASEFSLLNSQIGDLYKQLKPLNKKFKTPDTAKLRQVAGADASRAQVVNKPEKEESKQAATAIIKLLSEQQPAIHFGIKGMLEQHDKNMLAELEKLAKSKKASPEKPLSKPTDYGSTAYHGPVDDYYGSPADYAPYYPSSYGRDYGDADYASRTSPSGASDQDLTPYKALAGKKKPSTDHEKSQKQDKAKKEQKSETDDSKKSLKKRVDKAAKLRDECNEKIKVLEENAEKFLKRHKDTLEKLDTTSTDAVKEAQMDLAEYEFRLGLTQIGLNIEKLISAAERLNAESNVRDEYAKIFDQMIHIEALAKLAQTAIDKAVPDTSKTFQEQLRECVQAYRKINLLIRPALKIMQEKQEKIQKLLKELSEKETKEQVELLEKELKELHEIAKNLTIAQAKNSISASQIKELKDKIAKVKTNETLKEIAESAEKQLVELEKLSA